MNYFKITPYNSCPSKPIFIDLDLISTFGHSGIDVESPLESDKYFIGVRFKADSTELQKTLDINYIPLDNSIEEKRKAYKVAKKDYQMILHHLYSRIVIADMRDRVDNSIEEILERCRLEKFIKKLQPFKH